MVQHRLSAEEEQQFYDLANQQKFADRKPEEVVAILLSEGTYLASVSTLYRILRKRNALKHRQESKKPVASAGSLTMAVTEPDQVWSWDITWLKTDVRGVFVYAYTIIDVYDRRIVGWCIEAEESEEYAEPFCQHTSAVFFQLIPLVCDQAAASWNFTFWKRAS
jgi:hypothetical protein